MKSLTELKRTLTPGTVLVVTQHEYPDFVGERTVVKTVSNRVSLTIPGRHGDESWWTLPKREHITFGDDGTVTVLRDPEWGDAGHWIDGTWVADPFMTFHLKD